MAATRDKENNVQRCSFTALEFTASVHKPKNKSYWAAVRRALTVFDWIRHRHNRAKLASHSQVHQAQEAKFWQCGMIDSQQHLLKCKHVPLIAIQANACTEQRDIARNLLKDRKRSESLQYLIKQFIDRSWKSNTAERATDTTMGGHLNCLYYKIRVKAITNHPHEDVH
jgi:hypothetical protein